MLLIENSISDDLYQKCVEELNEKLSQRCWVSSSLNWGPDVKKGVNGSCLVTPVSNNIHYFLEKELKSLFPKHRKLEFNYYVWQPQSGISWHSDNVSGRSFGGTLYLNEEWFPNDGGWFIWEDENGHHTILPRKKFLVVNDNGEPHCVTPVTFGFRFTIQIWGFL